MANTLNIQLKISKMHMHRINWCRIAMACSTLGPIPQFDHSPHKSWLEVTPHQHNVHKCTESLIDFVMDPSTQQVLFPRPNRGYKSWPKSHYRGNRVPSCSNIECLSHVCPCCCLQMSQNFTKWSTHNSITEPAELEEVVIGEESWN